MKREGRQHGVVSCYHIFDPASLSQQRFVKMVDSASTMGLFAKVPTKPTNHSKFTGKCRKPRCNGCHLHPVCKSKTKAKGAMKLRSIDPENELTKYSFGNSATGVLAYLVDGGGYDNDDYDYDYDYEDRVEENYKYSYDYGYGYDYDDDDCHDDNDDGSSHDDETMSFCDVGLCWGDGDEYVDDDDGWYLVGGLMM
ncbi:hypothetical protein L1987_43768 [Smallanthus sonchifolius]|uniref:Uncharacterized protein n=1 Tax=Smallanthus sonchifolius TaxID=185202 RepID=A0ACB9GMG5_9ASTR|nr:hypothetical protein L1987_43768 [Smallanthus sonchifolius]